MKLSDFKKDLSVLNTLTFTKKGDKTVLNLRAAPINVIDEEQKMFESHFDSLKQGFTGTLNQLEDFLAI